MFHRYLNPERDIDSAAEQVHGISAQMLEKAPRFADIAAELIEFISGAELVIHNADFDVGFLNSVLRLASRPEQGVQQLCRIMDTLALARRLHRSEADRTQDSRSHLVRTVPWSAVNQRRLP